jgi:hypothetical protein
MMKKRIGNVAASVRQRLLNLRGETGEDFNALLTQYAIERFLYRLSGSSHRDRFVLKGAMLFRVWSGTLHRPTRDVDLLGYGEPTPAAVSATIREIITTAVDDDGIVFVASSVAADEIRESQEYGGVRVTFQAVLDGAVIPMQVDVGFADAVRRPVRLGGAGGVREETSSGLRESQDDAGGPAREGSASQAQAATEEEGELTMRLHSIRIEGGNEIA